MPLFTATVFGLRGLWRVAEEVAPFRWSLFDVFDPVDNFRVLFVAAVEFPTVVGFPLEVSERSRR